MQEAPSSSVPAVLPPLLLEFASSCPRCESPASPQPTVQRCRHCGKPFVLVAGARLDSQIVVPPKSGEKPVKVTYSDVVMRHAVVVDDDGINDAELDPVTGRIPVGKTGAAFEEIVTIAFYRRVDWVSLIALILLGFPVVAALVVFSFMAPWLFLLSVPALALFGLGLKKTVGIGVQRMRVASSTGIVSLRFDTPMRKRKAFLEQTLKRSGISDIPWT